jgi:hypothetical protein|tara:strand:- start:442 stop:675 length:234 start_codon:yes stop_codon:yes gene_type:complete
MKVNGIKCKTQTEAVLQHLKMGKTLTQEQATKLYGTQRLGAIVYDLRHKVGYDVLREDCVGKNRFGNSTTFGKYYLP